MERCLSQRKTMDVCLRRLKQELLSMKEAGDNLHEQMNSMMGALQELKLLQVQTALEQLDISGSQRSTPALAPWAKETPVKLMDCMDHGGGDRSPTYSEDEPSTLSSSIESSCCSSQNSMHYASSPTTTGSSGTDLHTPLPTEPSQRLFIKESPCRNWESRGSMEDTSDWTSSLMCQTRNRQPLVLGDNIFADLVENWLDLPEVEKKSLEPTEDHSLRMSRSQEICRKISLTANMFKKILRSVRPDKDKLLKEKPGWLPLADRQADVSKRAKKVAKPKGTFYLPFRVSVAGKKGLQPADDQKSPRPPVYIAELPADSKEKVQPPLFDYNTAVWV
ncbi:PAK4-inhibitor INKA2 isoform X1 [Polypterus senegalus]|uniref:PAK4-inhibitor INKA2 isoform X1 n=1 Tax=Polypterus senegalus TaxID=55291 RepID=UPI001962F739|nr:PAK4-inhibitor INKA2 isoform X1 [Polypterus senegalus]